MAAKTKISNLARHNEKYVTVGQLAEYWQISRKQIYKQIDAGVLKAIRLGPRLYRVQTAVALEFEERAQMRPAGKHRRAKSDSRDR